MSEKPSRTPAYLWFDAEFTSLELESAELLQVALMATNADLERLAPAETDLNLFIKIEDREGISPWVLENIPQIVDGCLSDMALDLEEVDNRLAQYVDEFVGGPFETVYDRPVLAGNSIHNDWFLARKHLPAFYSRLHYRILDVSTIKLQWQDCTQGPAFDKESHANIQKYFPHANLSDDMIQHDAYYDIHASIAELAFYRQHFEI